jgi:hypothetical protein
MKIKYLFQKHGENTTHTFPHPLKHFDKNVIYFFLSTPPGPLPPSLPPSPPSLPLFGRRSTRPLRGQARVPQQRVGLGLAPAELLIDLARVGATTHGQDGLRGGREGRREGGRGRGKVGDRGISQRPH